ncbi:ComF family protein [Pseudoflavonifractor sp. 524-17]|uniref:ComF family protein n=1 Tax=Pseudoflavonifractor sp. 524-17 TaxID=2304577 RepID=UPI0013794AF4|nr:ComF family protein [Pseudoflavonifractor sp. 524-17]NCE65271.1 ComF family protein [Pseudoflavonifractor sp. 524-17]
MNRGVVWVLDLLFPPKCAFCGGLLADGEVHLCAGCRRELPWLKGAQAEQACENITLAVSPLRYQGKVRDSIRRYKFHGRRGYAKAYGPLVAACIQAHLPGRFDLLTWAPLSDKRKRQRGYDQAFLLAKAAGKALGIAPTPLLKKTRHTAAQSGLDGQEARRTNIQGAYQAVGGIPLVGKRVLLLDDVITTGSTASACARALLDAGAAEVLCATVARAR